MGWRHKFTLVCAIARKHSSWSVLMIHIPILRAGKPYYSLDTVTLTHFETGEAVALISQANPGLIAHDLNRAEELKQVLDRMKVKDLLSICVTAAKHFAES